MARTYREIAIENMVLTVEEAMSRVIVKKALDTRPREPDTPGWRE
jgi:hypothetical protein